jgi:hypothetical protein
MHVPQRDDGTKGVSPCNFQLPVLCEPKMNVVVQGALPFVCMSAMQLVSGKKVSFWRTCMKAVQANIIPKHGLVGKVGNATKFDEETLDDLRSFFLDIESFCDVVPTRFVRNKTGATTTREKNERAMTLPPCWSKRSLYCRWCYERGWNIEDSIKGTLSKVKRTDWPPDMDHQPVISWTYFFLIWKREYSYISVRRPTADICDDCYVFYNQVKYKRVPRLSTFVPVDSTDNEDCSSSDDCSDKKEQGAPDLTLDWKTESTIHEDDSFESMVEKAGRHVQQAREMRLLLNGKARLALDWYKSIKDEPTITDDRWESAIDTIVGDYCQNLALPWLGKHQPGETYYFSPLTVNCFGIANVGMEKALLTAYIYHEGEGKKGGNNVASLIHKYLDDQALINQNREARKELNVVMDNCDGQSKNQYVLRLATLFVELHYYRHINLIFLVLGHTKNAADCLFNLLKKTFRKSQVFTMEQLQKVLDSNEYVECKKVGKEDFRNYGKFKDTVYKHTPLTGNTKKY